MSHLFSSKSSIFSASLPRRDLNYGCSYGNRDNEEGGEIRKKGLEKERWEGDLRVLKSTSCLVIN